ncbi:MAG: hypothetical protein ACLP59_29640 [Bryobacteraceae bacterium]
MPRAAIRTAPLILLLAMLSSASTEPNFTGEWKMDPSRSSFSPLPAPDSLVRRIVHQGSHLKIATTQWGQQREITTELSYTTDGKRCKNIIRGEDVSGSAHWSGAQLVIESAREVQGMQIGQRETWTLSDDGQTLTIVNHVQTPQAAFDITIVLERQHAT